MRSGEGTDIMFHYALAEKLCITVSRLMEEMPEHEREGWLAYMKFQADRAR